MRIGPVAITIILMIMSWSFTYILAFRQKAAEQMRIIARSTKDTVVEISQRLTAAVIEKASEMTVKSLYETIWYKLCDTWDGIMTIFNSRAVIISLLIIASFWAMSTGVSQSSETSSRVMTISELISSIRRREFK